MWHSSRVCALRRGPNSHKGGRAAKSRAGMHVGTRSAEELTQDAPSLAQHSANLAAATIQPTLAIREHRDQAP